MTLDRRLGPGLAYALAFVLQYPYLCAPLYGYWGFSRLGGWECLYLVPLMVFPVLALPERLDRPSALFAVLNYAVLYVPLCVLLFHSTRTSIAPQELWAIWASLALATVFLGLVPRTRTVPWKGMQMDRKLLLTLCWTLVGAVVLAALAVARVHGVDLKQTALARSAYATEVHGLGVWFTYADAWVGLAFIPFLLAESLRRSRWWVCLGLSALCVLLFLLSGRKTLLFCPLTVLAAFWAVDREVKPTTLLWTLAGLLLLPFAFKALALKRLADVAINVVNFRVFAVPQILVPQYYAYYAQHGFTLFRHVNAVNRLFFGGGAFEQPWSAIAGFYYHAHFTADAMPYATDGLAALGLAGVPLVALLLAALFWVLDRVTARHSPALVLAALVPFLFSLCNNSLFTSLLTGGGLLLLLLFTLLPDSA